jgi:hypothetical protein
MLQRTVIVPPELGYGKKGINEIPVFFLFIWRNFTYLHNDFWLNLILTAYGL